MSIIKELNGIKPKWGDNCFFVENSVIVGDVVLGDNCTLWYNSVVRGDVNSIRIGNNTNIQDGAIIHCTYKTAKTTIGNNVSIGHNAIVHGCEVEDNVLIGMGAIVMDNAKIGKGSFIAAGAIVLANTIIESGCLYAGVPARKVKEVDETLMTVIKQTAENYIMYAEWYK